MSGKGGSMVESGAEKYQGIRGKPCLYQVSQVTTKVLPWEPHIKMVRIHALRVIVENT